VDSDGAMTTPWIPVGGGKANRIMKEKQNIAQNRATLEKGEGSTGPLSEESKIKNSQGCNGRHHEKNSREKAVASEKKPWAPN